mmetsp:Transcript_11991/g.26689  ORF Transcript_11991/g.26689 Transcript_11991/m.26689 type:complete len:283 (+) Transcript_11991:1486-2334(+)
MLASRAPLSLAGPPPCRIAISTNSTKACCKARAATSLTLFFVSAGPRPDPTSAITSCENCAVACTTQLSIPSPDPASPVNLPGLLVSLAIQPRVPILPPSVPGRKVTLSKGKRERGNGLLRRIIVTMLGILLTQSSTVARSRCSSPSLLHVFNRLDMDPRSVDIIQSTSLSISPVAASVTRHLVPDGWSVSATASLVVTLMLRPKWQWIPSACTSFSHNAPIVGTATKRASLGSWLVCVMAPVSGEYSPKFPVHCCSSPSATHPSTSSWNLGVFARLMYWAP